MRISEAQRTALRVGAVMLLLGAVVLAVVAVTLSPGEPAPPRMIESGEDIDLPRPGLFGGSATVYGSPGSGPTPTTSDLECQLLDSDGDVQSSAKMSSLAVLGSSSVEVDGTSMRALFEVDSYEPDSRVRCEALASVMPVAVSSSATTFGSLTGSIRLMAATTAVLFLVLGILGLVVLRRPRSA